MSRSTKKPTPVSQRDMAQRMLIERKGAGAGKHHTRERDVAKGIRRKGKHPEKLHENPQQYKDQPVEITLKNERLDESSIVQLAPGVNLVMQISRTGKRVPVTHGEQRLLLCLQDDQGKRVQFYQSFAGTGGKQQGWWFPTGGVMADDRGRGAWIIKGSPRTDPGAGRVPLLEFYQRVNEVLPHTDPDTDAWLMRLVGMDYGDFSYKDEYEIVPFIRITEAGNSNELQKKWGSWCYQFWALMVLDKIWGKRTFTPERTAANPYKAVIPIVSGIALANSGQKSFPPAFWRWFKDSKVTAPYGEPEVVYHGTTSGGFDAFRPNYREGEMLGFGIHFARDRKFAEYYTKESDSGRKGGSRPEVYEAYLSIQNPIDFTADKFVEGTPEFTALEHMLDIAVGANETAGIVKRNYDGKKYLEPFLWMLTAELRPSVVERIIRENGFDGVVYMARFLAGSHLAGKRTVAYIVFSPTQIKSATKNSGAYDPKDPRITHNPIDLAGRHIPERYLAGLPPALQKQRIRELTESRDAYRMGDYSELPTDRAARKMGLVKQSSYTKTAKDRGIEYRGDFEDMAERVMDFYGHRPSAREVNEFAAALKKSFSKGLAAWKSGGHRPGATAQNWAVARVNSLVVGGKTSWTADKKQFEVLPDEVRAKIESLRSKQNPIRVQVEGAPSGKEAAGRHTRFYQSRAALDRIEEQGREVVPDIKFRIEWGYKLFEPMRQKGRIRFERGERGVVTLVADATKTQSLSDAADQMGRGRPGKVSLYTAHTILHRLGDNIMPVIANLTLMDLRYEPAISRGVTAGLVVTERVERAWRKLSRALYLAWDHFGYSESSLDKWFPTVVDTKACREGWITDSLQAMAETVPYRLLYKKGRENGVKLLSDLPFVPDLEAALTEYIDASMEMLKGYQVEI